MTGTATIVEDEMAEIPSDLKAYLEAVREANERIVEQKLRQLDPNLRDDDQPWLASENEQIAAHFKGYADYFGKVVRAEDGSVVSGDPKKGEDEAFRMFGSLVSDPSEWKTWHDVIRAAKLMNAEIDKLLK